MRVRNSDGDREHIHSHLCILGLQLPLKLILDPVPLSGRVVFQRAYGVERLRPRVSRPDILENVKDLRPQDVVALGLEQGLDIEKG